MRKAEIIYKNLRAGWLEETPDDDDMYRFTYDPLYLDREDAEPVSLTLPLRAAPFRSEQLFPFFDGLIPEGWLLDVALRNTDISILDRMGLLLLCCKDCIGAVSVIPMEEPRDE